MERKKGGIEGWGWGGGGGKEGRTTKETQSPLPDTSTHERLYDVLVYLYHQITIHKKYSVTIHTLHNIKSTPFVVTINNGKQVEAALCENINVHCTGFYYMDLVL